MILADNQRRIAYRNRAASQLLLRGHVIVERDGALACRHGPSDAELGLAFRELLGVSATASYDGAEPAERRTLRIRSSDGRLMVGTLVALRRDDSVEGRAANAQLLFSLCSPAAAIEVDPALVSGTFGLTPAEGRLAAMLANGHAPDECAGRLGVKISTVRSQLLSIYSKTGASGQTSLVRMILSINAI
jgi:DNA-binding CsgD family transcriptional regulator